MEVRALTPADLAEVRALHEECFPVQYPESFFIAACAENSIYITRAICLRDAAILGVIVVRLSKLSECDAEDSSILKGGAGDPPQVAYILTLGVRRSHRRHGIALRLVGELVSLLQEPFYHHCKAIFLHVLVENEAAIAFYNKVGFVLHARLYDYYTLRDGVVKDAFTYVLYLNGGVAPLQIWKMVVECAQDMSRNVRRCIGW